MFELKNYEVNANDENSVSIDTFGCPSCDINDDACMFIDHNL